MTELKEPKGWFKKMAFRALSFMIGDDERSHRQGQARNAVNYEISALAKKLVEEKLTGSVNHAIYEAQQNGGIEKIIKSEIEKLVSREVSPIIAKSVSEEFLSKDKVESYSDANLHPNYLSQHQGF